MAEISDLDPVDANNTTRFPEGMQFRNVNDGVRADEGLLARWFRDTNGSLSASGSAGAYAVTANRTITSYVDNLIIGFTANHTNLLGAATLAVSGLLPKSIDGVLASEIVSGAKVLVVFNVSTDKWQRITTPPVVNSPVQIKVGSVLIWPTATIPTGFLLANGQSVAVASYPALFAEYAYTYGGSGANFTLPNYKDYFLRGFDSAGTGAASRTDRGDGTTGANVGTKQSHGFQTHVHSGSSLIANVTDSGHVHPHAGGSSATAQTDEADNTFVRANGGNTDSAVTGITVAITGNTGAPGTGNPEVETRPNNITVNFIIVATPGAALATSGIGKNSIGISARHMTARATAGAGSATFDSGSNDITLPVFDFDTTTQEYVHFEWLPPKRWDRGTVTFEPIWTNAAGLTTETVVFSLAGVAISNDDPLNAAMGTVQTSTDTWIAQGDVHRGPESAAITIGGTPAEGDLVVFELSRVVGSDNMTGDARLIGIRLFWTSNAVSDD